MKKKQGILSEAQVKEQYRLQEEADSIKSKEMIPGVDYDIKEEE